jgi:hypothetical protein
MVEFTGRDDGKVGDLGKGGVVLALLSHLSLRIWGKEREVEVVGPFPT